MQTYLLDQFSTWFPSLAEPIALLMINVAQIIGILVVAKIIKAIINRYLVMWVEKSQGSERATTLSQLIKTTLSFLIWFLVILLSLDTVGINITPILASAGVLGLAVGFGSQNLVRDVVTGFFHFLDNAFNVGEIIEVGGFTGKVTKMTLREVRIVNYLGAERIIPQGEITSLTNWSRNDNTAIVDFGVDYATDLSKLSDVMQAFVQASEKKYDALTEAPAFLGVMELADSSINCRLLIKTKPGEHWATSRAIRADLVAELTKASIDIPFPHVVVKQS